MLAAAGGVAGLLFAWLGAAAARRERTEGIPRLANASLDPRVVGAALVLVCASTLLVGLLPAWQAARRHDWGDELGGKGTGDHKLEPWIRQSLIGGARVDRQ